MIPASSSVGIGITTRNRWADLAVTLANLRDEGLDRLETVVIDDGSHVSPGPAFFEKFPWVRFERFEESQGYIVQRNRVAGLLSTRYYLSLDDDSFPVAGDLAAAAKWLDENPKVAALAFQVILGDDPQPKMEKASPVLVKDFIGCGFMLRRELFLSLGGFEERLHFYHEEPEYCFRTFQRGYETYLYPAVVIRHMVTSVSRMQGPRTRYFTRNVVLLDLWYYPLPGAILRAVGHGPSLYFHVPKLRPHPGFLIWGWLEGFVCYLSWFRLKSRLSRAQCAAWKERPGAHQAMGTRTTS